MSQKTRFLLLAGAAAGLSGSALAQQQQQGTSPEEVRAIVAEMLADADSRSSLLAAGGAGHDGVFYLANADGSYRLNIRGLIQTRYYMNFRDDDNTIGERAGDDFEPGFQTGNTWLDFSGTIMTDWFYQLRSAFDIDDGTAELQYAYAGYNFGSGTKFIIGQFKTAFLREEMVDDPYQLAVERSVVNQIFNQDFSQGIQIIHETLDWRLYGQFTDGVATSNTAFTDPWQPLGTGTPPTGDPVVTGDTTGESDYGLGPRFEYKFAGEWSQFDQFTAEQNAPFASMVGAAINSQTSPNSGESSDVDTNIIQYTVDATLKGNGWNAFGAFVGRHLSGRNSLDNRAVGGDDDLPDVDDFGVVLQAGFRIVKDTELFGRWDGLFLDDDFLNDDSAADQINFITVGVNQYYAGQAAKATVDVVYAVEETTNLVGRDFYDNGGYPSTNLGLLGDSEEGETVLRLQFQLMF
jgi:hypothetical protein